MKRLLALALLIPSLCLSQTAVSGVYGKAEYRTFRVLISPDSQCYSEPGAPCNGSPLPAMQEAIGPFAESNNVDAIIGLGDTFQNTLSAVDPDNVDAFIASLNASNKPWGMAVGNHDLRTASPAWPDLSARNPTVWDDHVGSVMRTKSWFIGFYPEGTARNAVMDLGTHDGVHWGAVLFEFCPTTLALAWAQGIMSARPQWQFLVFTHSFLTPQSLRDGKEAGVDAGCSVYSLSSDNEGDAIWTWAKALDTQILLIVNGHYGGTANRSDAGDNGLYINQVLVDFQNLTNGGNGYIRLLDIFSDGTARMTTYSPYLGTYKRDSANEFSLRAR